jgi:hypothetical protein
MHTVAVNATAAIYNALGGVTSYIAIYAHNIIAVINCIKPGIHMPH